MGVRVGFDFASLGDASASAPTDPRVLFNALSRADHYEFLRDPQGQVLEEWYRRREEQDLVVKLNTGAGKTLVGLIMCQSSLNEGLGPALYLAPDPYLAEQAAQQATELGLDVVTDRESLAFTRGEAICVLSLHRIINGKSGFGLLGGDKPIKDVGTIVVDDAHAALATVREKFTLTVSRQHHQEAYDALLELFEDDLRQQSEPQYLDIASGVPSAVVEVPFWAWQRHIPTVTAKLHALREDEHLQWPWPLVKDVLPLCRAVFTAFGMEIQPPHPPIGKIASFTRARRRIHLTATLADDSVLVTDFAASADTVKNQIVPASAGYLGDRLILAPREISPAISDDAVREMAADLAASVNVVVLAPSYAKAALWQRHAAVTAAKSEDIADAVRRLREEDHVGLVVLVNKYDGIDLPRSACEILVVDGLPEAYGGLTRREEIVVGDSEEMVARQLQRIEQGMGRGVRSVNDHCVVLLLGPRLSQLMASPKHRAQFGPATRAQIDLSRQVAHGLEGQPLEKIRGVVHQVLDRDPDWIRVSRQKLADVAFPPGHVSPIAELTRDAFDQATLQQYAQAASLTSRAVNAAEEPAVKGMLQEQLAAYQNFLDPAKAQQTLVGALRHNPSLTRPLVGVKATRISPADVQAKLAADYLSHTYGDRNSLLLGVDALLDDLVYPTPAPVFEAALEELGRHLGFEAQRPERTLGNGPDVLWALGKLRYLVLEAKSYSTTDKIWRDSVEQLAHSMNWFTGTYDATCIATPVLLHPVNTLERNATAPPGCRIVTTPKLAALREAARAVITALAEGDNWMDASAVADQISANHLTANDLVARYMTTPRATR